MNYSLFALDIETLSTESNAVILSIGLVPFEAKPIFTLESLRKNSCFVKFNAREQQTIYNRSVSKDTLKWWSEQSKASQAMSLIPSASDMSVIDGLSALTEFYHSRGGTKNSKIYTRGSFDQMITDSLFKAADMKPLAPYYSFRDIRTFIDCLYPKSERGYIKVDTTVCTDYNEDKLVAHDPVEDCLRDIAMMLAGEVD
jgi:hypothetical protein